MKELKILLAEDNRQLNDLLCMELSEDGHKMTPAYSGLEALELLKNNTYDLLICDYNLGDLVATDFFTMMDDNLKNGRPVIFLSTGDLNMEETIKRFNVAELLRKPIDYDQLLGYIQKHFP